MVETLVAMGIVSAVLLPAGFWLYKSRAGRAAAEKFQATQALEMQMHRAFLLRLKKDWSGEAGSPPFRLDIKVATREGETRLLGTAKNREGKIICRLEADLFGETP